MPPWMLREMADWLVAGGVVQPEHKEEAVVRLAGYWIGKLALVWVVSDVQEVCPKLSDIQAEEVLLRIGREHDANHGVTWDTLRWAGVSLFGAEACGEPGEEDLEDGEVEAP